MKDDAAVVPTEEGIEGEIEVLDPADSPDIEGSPDPETGDKPEDTLVIAEHTTLAPPELEETELPETTATPEPTAQPATQVEVIKAIVNVRSKPGGGILFKVKRGAVAEVTGDIVSYNGWKWYPVLINDEEGFLRGDTVKELAFPITITPTPAPKDETDNESEKDAADKSEKVAETLASSETLKRGSKGEAVKALQTRLIELGYLNDKADGSFGRKTESAVKEAQGIWGMKATGVVDDAFLNLLYSDSATNLDDAKIMALQPDTMRVATKPALTGLDYMKKNYEKSDKSGYTASIVLNNVGKDYALTASIVDNYTTTYESKISFTDAAGAKAINPSFKLTLVNLYIQDANKLEFMRKDEVVRELIQGEWTIENGLIVIDLSKNSTLASEFLDTKAVDAIRASNDTTSYKVEISKNSLPYQITNYMNKIWKDMNGEEIAKAADWASGQ
ncbi:MAG: peptidoglycan-binding protein [Christensenellaceae bacterium]|nr:peptidoglycan-binding protein [Christensenellaceae bacterium]